MNFTRINSYLSLKMPPAAAPKAEAMEVDKAADGKEKTEKKEPSKSVDAVTVESWLSLRLMLSLEQCCSIPAIREHCRVIERSEVAKEPRQVLRVLRHVQSTRKVRA